MAVMQPVRAKDRPPYLKRALITSLWRGQLRVSRWPKRRPAKVDPYQQALRDNFTATVQWVKRLLPIETNAMRAAIEHQNRTHRGFKGSAAIRLRDIELQRLYGRLWALQLPDGRVLHSEQVAQEISDVLDWCAHEPGAMLQRGGDIWTRTAASEPGDFIRS